MGIVCPSKIKRVNEQDEKWQSYITMRLCNRNSKVSMKRWKARIDMVANLVNQIILELADQFLKIGESVIKRLKTTGGHWWNEI